MFYSNKVKVIEILNL